MNRFLAAIALSAIIGMPAAVAQPVTLRSVFAVKARSPAAAAELDGAKALTHTSATYTGKQSPPEARIFAPLLSAWAQDRKLDRGSLERQLHDNLLEFEDGGERHWLLLAYPANHRVTALNAGQRVELLVQRIGFAYGRPVVLAFHAGTPDEIAAVLKRSAPDAAAGRESVAVYRAGALRFEFAGERLDLAMTPPDLSRSILTTHSRENVAELSLFYGDISRRNARLRLRGLTRPGEFPGYADFEGDLDLTGTHIRLNPSVLRDCKLAIARIDAQGADGTLSCERVASVPDFVPARFEFSARP